MRQSERKLNTTSRKKIKTANEHKTKKWNRHVEGIKKWNGQGAGARSEKEKIQCDAKQLN